MGEENKKEDQHKRYKKNWLEWIVFGISVLLTIGVIAYLGYKTYSHQPAPPDIKVTYRPSATTATPYRYHLSIENNC